jgi:hypothetical protein
VEDHHLLERAWKSTEITHGGGGSRHRLRTKEERQTAIQRRGRKQKRARESESSPAQESTESNACPSSTSNAPRSLSVSRSIYLVAHCRYHSSTPLLETLVSHNTLLMLSSSLAVAENCQENTGAKKNTEKSISLSLSLALSTLLSCPDSRLPLALCAAFRNRNRLSHSKNKSAKLRTERSSQVPYSSKIPAKFVSFEVHPTPPPLPGPPRRSTRISQAPFNSINTAISTTFKLA